MPSTSFSTFSKCAGGLRGQLGSALLVLLLATGLWAEEEKPVTLDEAEILAAIEAAKQRLIDAQRQDGSWEDPTWEHSPPSKVGGHTALCTYALLQAGVDPRGEVIARAVNNLLEQKLGGTYNTSFRCMVLAHLANIDARYRIPLNKDVSFLLKSMLRNGCWTYIPVPGGRTRGDNSNAQIAVLALREAYYAGAEIPISTWKRIESYWVQDQYYDGGWGYSDSRRRVPGYTKAYGSMSAAGLATAFILLDILHSSRSCSSREYRPVHEGLKWFAKNFRADRNPRIAEVRTTVEHEVSPRAHLLYYLYGVERIGEASGYKLFGKHDWFVEGATELLRISPDGNWPFSSNCKYAGTAFGLVFLAKGTAPVLFNKLVFGRKGNPNPRDVANLVRYLSRRKFERHLNWQIVDVDADLSQWMDSPVLFIGAASPPKLSDEQVEKLRTYLETGGTLFCDAACSKSPIRFRRGLTKLIRRMYPGRRLTKAPVDHPVYTVHFRVKKKIPIMVAGNGCRDSILFSPSGISGAWHTNRFARQTDDFLIAANVYLYATDKTFRNKLTPTSRLPRKTRAAESLKVAHLKHAGNWNPCPLGLSKLSEVLAARADVELEIAAGMEPEDPALADCAVAFLTAGQPPKLSDAQIEALAGYTKAGGTLILHATLGRREAAGALLQLAARIAGQDPRPLPQNDPIITGQLGDSPGFDLHKVRFTSALGGERRTQRFPNLLATGTSEKLGVVVSVYDFLHGCSLQTPYRNRGYPVDTANQVAANLFLAVHRSPQTQPTSAPVSSKPSNTVE